jgi:adenylate cyclase
LFADVVGSMQLAATLGPERLREIMTAVFNRSTSAVQRYGGTVDKFTGDGIMAVFGAPIEMPDHADRALAAARAKLRELDKFNQWIRAEYGLEKSFRMGIGLTSGEVMSGNVGSEKRLAYTAIGDTTNTASRLEGMTKGSDYMLFMAESTKNALSSPPDDLTSVGEYEIRGRVEKLSIWSVEESRKPREEGSSFASVAQGPTLADK